MGDDAYLVASFPRDIAATLSLSSTHVCQRLAIDYFKSFYTCLRLSLGSLLLLNFCID
jgi:hypothetical protein